jgi:hypothetical protein
VTSHRRYHFECPRSQEVERVAVFLERRCEQFWWFTESYVDAEDPGLNFGFTVHARDQWWCHRRAVGLASEVYELLHLSPALLPVPLWETLAPHTNRGRYRH